jgi:dephospho-CoA kinase
LINDDSVEQGLQHIALVLMLELADREVHKAENGINNPQFVPISSLAKDYRKYEYWSQLCIQAKWGKELNIGCEIETKPNFSLRNQSEMILIVGFIDSGKTLACNLLENKFNYINVRCSKIMADVLNLGPREDLDRVTLQDEGYRFIQIGNGHERLAKGIYNFMSENPGKRYVLDGLRYPETLTALEKMVNKPITIIYIDTLIENLWKHYNDRNFIRITFSDYLKKFYHPVEKEIQRFRPIADIVIHNNNALSSFKRTLENLFNTELR